MNLSDALAFRLDASLAADDEVHKAFSEFLKNIPGRILQCDVDVDTAQKKGVVKGESVYKFGSVPEKKTVFLEYFAHRDQGAPTMAIFADGSAPSLTVKGTKVEKQFYLQFTCVNGKIVAVRESDP